MSHSNTVHVRGISQKTTDKEVRDFFSFCGKISHIEVTPDSSNPETHSATVTFEKETAAKTALLLDMTQLGPSQVQVTAAETPSEHAEHTKASNALPDSSEISQEDKPRSRVAAEMLAHGYVLSDVAIGRALALDQQHGVSQTFMNTLTQMDQKFQATSKLQAVDQKFGVTDKAWQGWKGLNSYFEAAVGTPTGQKLRSFYETGSKQVLDVHNEAKHLAEMKTHKAGGSEEAAAQTVQQGKEGLSAGAAQAQEAIQQTAANVSEKVKGSTS